MERDVKSPLEKLAESYNGHKEFYHNVGAGLVGVAVFSGGVVVPAALGVGIYQGGKWLYHKMEEKKE